MTGDPVLPLIPIMLRPTFVLLSVLSVLFVACSPVTRNQSISYYQSNPISLFNFAFAQAQRLSSFEGSGPLSVESPQGGFNGTARVYYQNPDSLLVQVKTGPGISVGFMLILGQRFWLYNIPDNMLWESRGRQVPLQELVGIDLDVPNIMDATVGLPGIEESRARDLPAPGSIQVDFIGEHIRYRFQTQGESHIYVADPAQEAFIAYSLVHEDDSDTIFYDFKQFQRSDGINIPRHIQITRPLSRERISFFYNRVAVNGGHSKNRFEPKVSEKAEKIQLTR